MIEQTMPTRELSSQAVTISVLEMKDPATRVYYCVQILNGGLNQTTNL